MICDRALRYHVITFGCQQNEADSERIRGLCDLMGYVRAEGADDADIVIVNTCAIREHAEAKALSLLGRFKSIKKKNPELILGVCGCMAAEPHRAEMLKRDFHYVSFTIEPNMLYKLPTLVLKILKDKRRSFILGEDCGDIAEGMPTIRRSAHKAWVSIMYGCNNFCTYCIVPYVRGRERSRASADIIAECRELAASGIKEITLLGQNVNSYRSDLSFAELLEQIALIPGDFLIRFMTSHPKDVSDALIEVMAKYTPKVAPFFHLPLQSGSDKILKAMHRTYSREKYLSVVDKLRAAVPGIALSTDVILGFPGEEEEDFSETVSVLESVRFDNVYSFLYSERQGTAAQRLGDSVPKEVKDRRMKIVLDLQGNISYDVNQPLAGKTLRVLVDSASERDGEVVYTARTDTNKLLHFKSKTNKTGRFTEVKVTKAGAFDLFGEEA
jgi:tRNA-2-methylthio-N6-dimethylallyladenosine synthase